MSAAVVVGVCPLGGSVGLSIRVMSIPGQTWRGVFLPASRGWPQR
jgi:hypothetical protein